MHEQCIDGHSGVLCAVCAPFHVREMGVCTKCKDNVEPDGTTGLATAATIPPFLLFFFLVYHFGKKEEKESDQNNAKAKKSDLKTKPTQSTTFQS